MLSKLLDISNNLYVTVISAECGEKRMTEKSGRIVHLTLSFSRVSSNLLFKGKWQQKLLSKQYTEVYYRIFISALFGDIF